MTIFVLKSFFGGLQCYQILSILIMVKLWLNWPKWLNIFLMCVWLLSHHAKKLTRHGFTKGPQSVSMLIIFLTFCLLGKTDFLYKYELFILVTLSPMLPFRLSPNTFFIIRTLFQWCWQYSNWLYSYSNGCGYHLRMIPWCSLPLPLCGERSQPHGIT